MRKNLCVGILKETRYGEKRTPLTPNCVNWLIKRGVNVEVQSSAARIFIDREYKAAGARVLDRFQDATLLLGIKEPAVESLYPDKIYMFFSHTTKGQAKNMPLLKACLKNNITFIDYEKIVDLDHKRLVYFGRFAGICGFVDSLHYLGEKLEWKGLKNPFLSIQPTHRYGSLKKVKDAMKMLDHRIRTRGFDKRLSPFIIGITGHGNVSRGIHEVFELLNPVEIHPKDIERFVKHQRMIQKKIYKIPFLPEEKLRSEDGKVFYLEEYLKRPKRFESNLDIYLPHLNMLLNGGYWDRCYPRLITEKMINRLGKKKHFRLEFIADIACDIAGSVELTYKTTTSDNPTFTYAPKSRVFVDGHKHDGVAILAVDNLPTQLSEDASREFSALVRGYVHQIALHGALDIKHCSGIPREVQRAVIAQGGRLTKDFKYLEKWIR